MSTSLIKGLIASGHSSQKIWVSDIDQEQLHKIATELKINIAEKNEEVVNASDVVVFAVKPQILKAVCIQTATLIRQKKPLVVSIAAGINQHSLTTWLGENVAIVRCMPNTPALVLTGATGLYANDKVNDEQRDLAENILRSVGISVWVENESQLDIVTAVSGSGPAYYFLLMEAMEKTAQELGLSESSARILVQQTALGAAKIALESTESPEQLRNRVTSPGGTTEQAVKTFTDGNFQNLVSKAIHAARNRSIQMSKEMGEA